MKKNLLTHEYFKNFLLNEYNHDVLKSMKAIYKNDHPLNHGSKRIMSEYIDDFYSFTNELQELLGYVYICYQQMILFEETTPTCFDRYLAYNVINSIPEIYYESEKPDSGINRLFKDKEKILRSPENLKFIDHCYKVILEDRRGPRLGSLGKGGSRGAKSRK